MAEMQWYAATDSGRFDGTAVITPRSGAVCLRAELPAGVLQNAVAALPWAMADDEKLFMNGYQTWTACPELGKWDRQHGVERVPKFLLEKYSFDRYGDYHFVPYSGKRGQSHGFSYCYFRRGKTYRLLAVWTRHRATRSFPMTAAPHNCALSVTAPGYSIPAAAFLRSPSFLPRALRTRYLTHGLRRWAAAPAPRAGWPGIPAGITATRILMRPRFGKISTAAKRFSAQGISFRSTMDGSAR